MKKIILNENHIRQLVKETLENLILGEDNMSNILSEIGNKSHNRGSSYRKFISNKSS